MPAAQDHTVLILAPIGQDAPVIAALLQAEGVSTRTCADPADCVTQIAAGAGALLLTEESLELPQAPALLGALKAQPAWSELPLIILTRGGEHRVNTLLDLAGTVTLLERPMGVTTLLRSVQVALRSRRRQYQVRDLLIEQQRQQQQLRESRDRLHLAQSAAQLGIYEYRPVTHEIIWDDRMRQLWGLGPNDPVSYELFMSRLHPDDRALTRAAVDRALDPNGNGQYYAEYRLVHPNRTIWVAATGRVTFENGRAVRLIGTVQDITERKAFQAELERLVTERTAKLQELVTELEHFSYTITHDMRAPLRAMQGFAEMFAEACAECQQQDAQRFLQRIRTAALRMDALVVDALSYNEALRKHLPLAPVDAGRLLRGMLDTYPELQGSHARIQVQPDIPLVFANEAGLTQVFSNLLNNAIKFAKPGQPAEICIRAELIQRPAEPSPDPLAGPKPIHSTGFAPIPSLPGPGNSRQTQWVRIWVEDHGIGISESMLPRVFNMFARGTHDHEGSGIGLALVRKVVDRMGGRVGVESQEGKGSRFWLELTPAIG